MSKTQITAEPGMPQIIVTREFDAPRDLVLRAYTEPDLLEQWLGPRDLALTVERYDTRDGGRWRYIHTDHEGNSYAFHGVFHGDPSPEAIVQTFEFEGAPGHVKLDTTTLEQRDGKTLVRTVSAGAPRRSMRRARAGRRARTADRVRSDLVVVRMDQIGGAKFTEPPLLVVEIRSPKMLRTIVFSAKHLKWLVAKL